MSPSPDLQLWIEGFGVAGLSATSYLSTNFDNLVVVSAYGARPGYRPFLVKLTFVVVCLTVLVVSFALAQAADTLPAYDLRYLGLIPMALGSYQLLRLIMPRNEDATAEAEAEVSTGFSAYFGFALVLLANSSDSVSVMTPLLADLKPGFVLACFAAAAAVAIAMGSLAGALGRHPAARDYIERLAERVLPFILIGIGALILADLPSDVFVG